MRLQFGDTSLDLGVKTVDEYPEFLVISSLQSPSFSIFQNAGLDVCFFP